MKIDVNKLLALSSEAIAQSREAENRIAIEKAKQKKIDDNAKADEIISKIPGMCEEAAREGRFSVLVITENTDENLLVETNYKDSSPGFHKREISVIDGPGVLVMNACEKAGLKVITRYQKDSIGREYAQIYASWDFG